MVVVRVVGVAARYLLLNCRLLVLFFVTFISVFVYVAGCTHFVASWLCYIVFAWRTPSLSLVSVIFIVYIFVSVTRYLLC